MNNLFIQIVSNNFANFVKAVTRDSRIVPGASVTEVELVKQLTSFGEVLIYLKYYMSLEQFFFIEHYLFYSSYFE